MPRDYTAKSWNIVADEKADALEKKKLDKTLRKKRNRHGHRDKIPPLVSKQSSGSLRKPHGRGDIETTIPSLAVSQIKL